jgi:hypothetical protein
MQAIRPTSCDNRGTDAAHPGQKVLRRSTRQHQCCLRQHQTRLSWQCKYHEPVHAIPLTLSGIYPLQQMSQDRRHFPHSARCLAVQLSGTRCTTVQCTEFFCWQHHTVTYIGCPTVTAAMIV